MSMNTESLQVVSAKADPVVSRLMRFRKGAATFAQRELPRALKVAGWVVFALYITGLATLLTRRASTFPVALAESSDAANAMTILNRTTWLSDNGFSYYGPLYYRLARSFMCLDPVYRTTSVSDVDIRDKSAHLALMLTSLFALILIAVVLGGMVGPDWALGWVSGLFLFAFLANSELWIDFSVDNHPDLVLSMFIAFATASTIKSLRPLTLGQTKVLWVAGAIWGLALLSKLTAATFYVSAVAVVAVAAWRGRCVVRALTAIGLGGLLTYMVVGFPQTLNVLTVLKSMRYVASVTVKTFDWIFWKNLLSETTALPLLVVVGVVLMFVRSGPTAEERKDPPFVLTSLTLMIPGIAFISLFWLSYQNHMRHYILPVVSSLTVASVPFVRRIALNGHRRLPNSLKPWWRVAGAVILVAVIIHGRQAYHHQTTSRVVARFQLQDEAETVQKIIRKHLEEGRNVVADPFVPVDVRSFVVTAPPFGFTKDTLGQIFDAEIFVSSRWYHERFLRTHPEAWTLLNLSEQDFRQRQDFYRRLEKDSFVDGAGRTWKLTLRTPLGWAVWENNGGLSPLTREEIHRMEAVRRHFSSEVLLDLDFSRGSNGKGDLLASLKSRQGATVEGPAKLVAGPWPGQQALFIQSTVPFTRVTLQPSALSLKKGTFAVWAQTLHPEKSSSILLSVNTVPGAPRSIYLERYGNGRFSVKFNGQPMTLKPEAFVLSRQWHHYVFTWDDKAQQFFIDGHLMGRSTFEALKTECRTFSLGWLGDNNDESQWPGPLAEVVTLQRSLSAEEVNVLYRIGMRDQPTAPKS